MLRISNTYALLEGPKDPLTSLSWLPGTLPEGADLHTRTVSDDAWRVARANALMIHYTANDQLLDDGEMVLMDAGCELQYVICISWPTSFC